MEHAMGNAKVCDSIVLPNLTIGSCWLILLSETALRTLQSSNCLMPAFLKQARILQKGKWSQLNSEKLSDEESTIAIYQTDLSDDFSFIWQVDVVYVHPLRAYAQVIKIWEIVLSTDKLDDILNNILTVYKTYESNLSYACQLRHGTSLPIVFPRSTEGLGRQTMKSPPNSIASKTENVISTTRFVPLSRIMIGCIQFGIKGEIPFLLSKEEYEVIEQKGSVLLLGRSGTGKTTCLVYRLQSAYKALYSEVIPHYIPHTYNGKEQPRVNQIFVTVSPILCNKIKAYFLKLKAAMESADSGKDSVEAAVSQTQKISHKEVNSSMLEEEDEDTMFSSIPDNFRALHDEHFPLFVTYQKLMTMIYGTLTASRTPEHRHDNKEFTNYDTDSDMSDSDDDVQEATPEITELQTCFSSRVVNYELFERFYWPKIRRPTFNPVLIWSEMISLIKGSESALQTSKGHLSAEQYSNCSVRCFPTFQHDREEVYNIFMRYESLKRLNFHVDLMDQVHLLYRLLSHRTYDGVPIHEIYCDEVQDLTISQIKLLQTICKNPDGFFFAGDTAQTIARGSAFTFDEVRAMMFRTHKEMFQGKDLCRGHLAPARMQLNDNYRSHGGILQLAASVIELIHEYFKGSIDKLTPDTALLDGPSPVFLEGCTHASLHSGVFGQGDKLDNSLEFGADQVIIVRSQEAKQNVQKTFNSALILTIYEAKGMEFNDVLLYNFFSDSPAELMWHVFQSSAKDRRKDASLFQQGRYAILCSELKHLYTAITRARKRLWMFDSNIDMRRPMLEYWKSLNLIEVESKLVTFAKGSTPREWRQKGIIFFENRLYKESKFCFTKANDGERVCLSQANILKQDAQASADEGDMQQAKALYSQSAELFKSLGRNKIAAQTLMSGEFYVDAGDIFCEIMKDYDAAAKAYHLGKEYIQAAKCLERLGKFTNAIEMYKEGGFLEIAISKMQDNQYLCKVNQSVTTKIIKLYCLPMIKQVKSNPNQCQEKIQHIKRALSLIPSCQREKILIDYGHTSLLELLRDKEGISTSQLVLNDAQMYSQTGQNQKAAQLYLEAARTLGTKMPDKPQVATQKKPEMLIKMSLKCLLQAVRTQIAVKLQDSAFETPLAKAKDGNILQMDADDQAIEKNFELAQNILKEAVHVHCQSEGVSDVNYNTESNLNLRYFDDINRAMLEMKELQAQYRGNLVELQDCLKAYGSANAEAWLDGMMRVSLILCYAQIQGKLGATWEQWADMQSTLLEIYKRFKTCLVCKRGETKDLEYCKRFFRVENSDDENSYRIVEDAVNKPLIQLLQQWQKEHKIEVISDETPLESETKVWRGLKSLSRNAMQIVLAKYVQETLHSAAQFARDKTIIQKPCSAYANLGNCRAGGDCHSSHSITGESIKHYLKQLAKQAKFAHMQVKLALEICKHYEDKDEGASLVQSAMRLSRYWLERMQESLHIISAFLTKSSEVLYVCRSSDIPKDGLKDLASRVWLNKKKEYNDYDVTPLLRAFYLIVQLENNSIPAFCRQFTRPVEVEKFPLPVWLIPASMIHTFFSKQKSLCRGIIHGDNPIPVSLYSLCDLAMKVWYERVCLVPKDEDWFAGCLRIQIIFVICSYHMDIAEKNKIWLLMQEVNQNLYEKRIHPTYLPVKYSNTLYQMRDKLVQMLNATHEPLTVIHVEGEGGKEVSWSEKNTVCDFEISTSGYIKPVDIDLHPVQKCDTSNNDIYKGPELVMQKIVINCYSD